jgi:hypothetical protein
MFEVPKIYFHKEGQRKEETIPKLVRVRKIILCLNPIF